MCQLKFEEKPNFFQVLKTNCWKREKKRFSSLILDFPPFTLHTISSTFNVTISAHLFWFSISSSRSWKVVDVLFCGPRGVTDLPCTCCTGMHSPFASQVGSRFGICCWLWLVSMLIAIPRSKAGFRRSKFWATSDRGAQ